jgi:hypothetical protein
MKERRSSNLRYVWIRIPPPVLENDIAENGGLQR